MFTILIKGSFSMGFEILHFHYTIKRGSFFIFPTSERSSQLKHSNYKAFEYLEEVAVNNPGYGNRGIQGVRNHSFLTFFKCLYTSLDLNEITNLEIKKRKST